MSEVPDGERMPAAQTTSTGIPIRNVWHMLAYSWAGFREFRAIRRAQTDAEEAPTVDALLALLLAHLVEQRLRVGLGRQYLDTSGVIRGIKGRIDFGESLKRLTFEQGMAFCSYESLDANIVSNQIVRSTLTRMSQVAWFGPSGESKLRHRLRRLVRDLDIVDLVEVNIGLVRRERLNKNSPDYQLMLAICELFWQSRIATENLGDRGGLGLDREFLTLSNVYERFVAEYYKVALSGWNVWPQKWLLWPSKAHSPYMPVMKPDLILEIKSTGQRVVLDTKFTAKSLTSSQYGTKQTFDPQHLYQLYSYLRSQEEQSLAHRNARGVLLYPTVSQHLDEVVEIQGHRVRIATVDLAKQWSEVEARLLEIVN